MPLEVDIFPLLDTIPTRVLVAYIEGSGILDHVSDEAIHTAHMDTRYYRKRKPRKEEEK